MNPHELTARSAKADRVAFHLHDIGMTATTAAELSETTRAHICRAVGVNPPSQATWDLVVAGMLGMERTAATRANPFAGLPS